jgi:outer membrane protein assembly factor BamB
MLNSPVDLGWVPDWGYISTTVADFNGDGELEIGWGTRCHYYILDRDGNLLWRTPLIEGFGIYRVHHSDGTMEVDPHGTGGPNGYAAGVGDLDGDPSLEIVLGFGPEYSANWDEATGSMTYEKVMPSNMLRAYDGEDGFLLWTFEGNYFSEDKIEIMHEPILVDVTGDKLLDVLALSSDRHLYILQGTDGSPLISYPLGLDPDPLFWVAHQLTFVVDNQEGIVFYSIGTDSTSPPTAILVALQVADGCK